MYEVYLNGSKLGYPDGAMSDHTEARMLAWRLLRANKGKRTAMIRRKEGHGWRNVESVSRTGERIDIAHDLRTAHPAHKMRQGDHFVVREKGRRLGRFIGRYLAIKPYDGFNAVDLNTAELVTVAPEVLVYRTVLGSE